MSIACPASVEMWAERTESRSARQRPPQGVQQSAAVAGPDLDHGRRLAGVADRLDERRRGSPRPAARASRRRTACRTDGVAGLEPFQLLHEEGRVGQVGGHLLVDPPGVHGDAVDGVQHGRADRDRVRRQQPGGLAEQPEPVARGDHQLHATGLRLEPHPRPAVQADRAGQAEVDEIAR